MARYYVMQQSFPGGTLGVATVLAAARVRQGAAASASMRFCNRFAPRDRASQRFRFWNSSHWSDARALRYAQT